jgi:hypothetical protein
MEAVLSRNAIEQPETVGSRELSYSRIGIFIYSILMVVRFVAKQE